MLIVILGLMLSGPAPADGSEQPVPVPQSPPAPPTYLEPVAGQFRLRPAINYSQLSFLVFDQTKDNKTLVTYRPNNTVFMHLDVGYRGFGFGGGFEVPGSEKDPKKYGESTASDYQVYYYDRSFGVDVFRQTYDGFYSELEPGAAMVAASPGDGIREDLGMSNTGGNVYFAFSDHFSLKAAFDQTERQIKTGSSFVLGGGVSYFDVHAKRSLLPPGDQYNFKKFEGYRGGEYLNLSVLPGFAMTYVPGRLENRLYMTFFAMLGGGITRAHVDTGSGDETGITDNYKVNAKYALGYNGDIFFTGASIVLDLAAASTFTKSSLNVGSGVMFIDAFAGIHLGKP